MTLYYWLNPQKYSDKYMAMYDHSRSPDSYLLFMGGRFLTKEEVAATPPIRYSLPNFIPPKYPPKDFSKIYLQFDAPKAKLQNWDCLINNSTAPVVNKRVAELLEKVASNDVQFFPVQVICEDGVSLDYCLVNITHEVQILDYEKSKYTRDEDDPNWITSYNRPIYKEACMGKHLIVRDADSHSHIIVSQSLVDAFKAVKPRIRGVNFESPEEHYRALYGDNFDRLNLFE